MEIFKYMCLQKYKKYIIFLIIFFLFLFNVTLPFLITFCIIMNIVNICKIKSYNCNNPSNSLFTLKSSNNYRYLFLLMWFFFFNIVLENDRYIKDLPDGSFIFARNFHFYDKALSPEMIVFYIVVCINIFLEIYVYKNNKPLICEDGFFTDYGFFISFQDITGIRQERDITKIHFTIKSHGHEYPFVFESTYYNDIINFLSQKEILIENKLN